MHSLQFHSLEELMETMTRGNEVQFRYRAKTYGIFPVWCNCGHDSRFNEVIGCEIGESNSEKYEQVSFEDLPDYLLDGVRFQDIFDESEVIERTI